MSKFKAPCSFIKDLYESAGSDINTILNTEHELWGHVRTIRTQADLSFISIYDGTHMTAFQCIVDLKKNPEMRESCNKIHSGAYIKVRGMIVKSPAKGQLIEMQAIWLDVSGPVVDNV